MYVVKDNFDLNKNIKKEQLVELLLRVNENNYKINQFESPSEGSFSDVPKDSPFYKNLEFAKTINVIIADDDGNFAIGEDVDKDYLIQLILFNLGSDPKEIIGLEDQESYLNDKYGYEVPFDYSIDRKVKIGESYSIFCDVLGLYYKQDLTYDQKNPEYNIYNSLGYNEIMSYDEFSKVVENLQLPVTYDLRLFNINERKVDENQFEIIKQKATKWNVDIDRINRVIDDVI